MEPIDVRHVHLRNIEQNDLPRLYEFNLDPDANRLSGSPKLWGLGGHLSVGRRPWRAGDVWRQRLGPLGPLWGLFWGPFWGLFWAPLGPIWGLLIWSESVVFTIRSLASLQEYYFFRQKRPQSHHVSDG